MPLPMALKLNASSKITFRTAGSASTCMKIIAIDVRTYTTPITGTTTSLTCAILAAPPNKHQPTARAIRKPMINGVVSGL